MAVPDASGFRETVYACAGLYGVLFVVSTAQLLRSCHRYRAWTTQKVLHLLLLLGCACRASFLGCLASWWDRAAGALGPAAMSNPAAHEAFYALDEPTISAAETAQSDSDTLALQTRILELEALKNSIGQTVSD